MNIEKRPKSISSSQNGAIMNLGWTYQRFGTTAAWMISFMWCSSETQLSLMSGFLSNPDKLLNAYLHMSYPTLTLSLPVVIFAPSSLETTAKVRLTAPLFVKYKINMA